MKRSLFYILIFVVLGSLPLLAVETGFTPGTQENLPAGAPSQEGCWEEELYSAGNDPILSTSSKECRRIVCGGNFWGKSATDICVDNTIKTEGTGESTITYKDVYIRRPSLREATELWKQKRFYLDPPIVGCGNYLPTLEELQNELEIGSETSLIPPLLYQWFIPAAYAIEPEGNTQLSDIERGQLAEIMDVTANSITIALASGNNLAVGAEGTLFRTYTNNALATARFLAHALEPTLYPCPEQLSGLCFLTDGIFHILWSSLPYNDNCHCVGGAASALNALMVNEQFFPAGTPGLVSSIAVHETWHILFQFVLGLFQIPNPTTPPANRVYYFVEPADPSVKFEDETTAYNVEAIFYHFLPQNVQDMISESLPCVASGNVLLYDNLQWDAAASIVGAISPSYVVQFFKRHMTPEEQQKFLACLADPSNNLSESDYDNAMALLKAETKCILQALGKEARVAELFQRLEDEMGARGGPCEISPHPYTLTTQPCKVGHVDLERDHAASPETQKVHMQIEGTPPPQNFDFEPPQASWDDTTNIPNNCAVALKSNSYSKECANWCWDHFPNGRDGGICQKITKYDAEKAGCNLSSGKKCEKAVAATCKNHPDWYPKACAKLCEGDSSICQQPAQGGGGGGGGGGGYPYISQVESAYGLTCPTPWIEHQNRAICEHGLGANCHPFVGKVLCCSGQLGGANASLWNSERNAQGQFCIPKPGAYNPTCPNRIWCGCGIGNLPNSNNCCSIVEACGLPSESGPDVYSCGSYSDSGGCQCVKTGECVP